VIYQVRSLAVTLRRRADRPGPSGTDPAGAVRTARRPVRGSRQRRPRLPRQPGPATTRTAWRTALTPLNPAHPARVVTSAGTGAPGGTAGTDAGSFRDPAAVSTSRACRSMNRVNRYCA